MAAIIASKCSKDHDYVLIWPIHYKKIGKTIYFWQFLLKNAKNGKFLVMAQIKFGTLGSYVAKMFL